MTTGRNGLVTECAGINRLTDCQQTGVGNDRRGVSRCWMSFADYSQSTVGQEDGRGWMVKWQLIEQGDIEGTTKFPRRICRSSVCVVLGGDLQRR